MSKQTYSEKLKDPRWQKKRLEILERDKFTCRHCRDKENTLHVHHAYYEKGKSPWEYDEDMLLTLCERCHSLLEARNKLLLKTIAIKKDAAVRMLWFADAIEGNPGPMGDATLQFAALAFSEFQASFEESMSGESREQYESSLMRLRHWLFEATSNMFKAISKAEKATYEDQEEEG